MNVMVDYGPIQADVIIFDNDLFFFFILRVSVLPVNLSGSILLLPSNYAVSSNIWPQFVLKHLLYFVFAK